MEQLTRDLGINEGASSSSTTPPTVSPIVSIPCEVAVSPKSTLFDELKKQVDAQGRVSMTQEEMANMLTDFIEKADPREVDSASPLVSALGLGSDDDFDDVNFNIDEIILDNTTRTKWIHVGRYTTSEALEDARKKCGVSRHQTGSFRGMTKMKYRCNQWKRNHCLYKMCSISGNGRYELYANGAHEHTVSEMRTTRDRRPNGAALAESIESNRHELNDAILQNALMQAIESISNDVVVPVTTSSATPVLTIPFPLPVSESSEFTDVPIKPEPSSPVETHAVPTQPTEDEPPSKLAKIETSSTPTTSTIQPPASAPIPFALPKTLLNVFREASRAELGENRNSFSLSSGQSISSLLEVATDLKLVFTFDARNAAEFCLHKTSHPLSIVFHDRKKHIVVKIRRENIDIEEECWKKGDFSQFVWAVRGKCSYVFR